MSNDEDDLWNELKSTLYKKLALAYVESMGGYNKVQDGPIENATCERFNHILSGFAKFALRVDKIPSN